MNFADYVDHAARNHPDRAAIRFGDRELTYDELVSQAASLGDSLAERGFESGDVLAIYAPNSPQLVVTVLACLKRGVNHLPLNLRFERDELAYVLEDAGARGIVATDTFADGAVSLLETVDSLETAVVTDDREGAERFDALVAAGDPADRNYAAKGDEVAGIMYTSGTTGKPKGVKHTHRNYIGNAMGFVEMYELSGETNTVTVAPCFHVAGLNITVTPTLVAGGTAALLPEWDPEAYLEACEAVDAHYSFIVPTMLMDLLHFENADEYDLSHMEAMIVGSAPVPEHAIGDFEEQFGVTITEGYGMTETTPLAVLNRPEAKKDGTIGQAYERLVDVTITDPQSREELPPGEVGEITVRGETVTPGYHDLPAVNEEQFGDVRSRTGDDEGASSGEWLYTGDLGWVGEDGYFRIEDRVDDMIITGGENVYPAEVEEVVSTHPDVRSVAVIGTDHERYGEAVTAIIVPSADDLEAEAIVDHCRDSDALANYKRPRRVEFVEGLPMTETRKIDKVSLRDRFD
ncbi:class I adenylate-forming enzyme family protein [Natrinema sp. 1APR25-10V2]|uniref:class I adenylate-forming enzyme family protein n=1 Tax=Natrinema sp. 1APR25-10V2 TaxID=2951081 RepID=UPI0028754E66|nr:class I adenylate-forming enzyme family protein [Natrinema sp. 1APR25-10V2]MDS0475583.1 acyl--CoA ligase [Natrinema sp. 1APR25-10V2]